MGKGKWALLAASGSGAGVRFYPGCVVAGLLHSVCIVVVCSPSWPRRGTDTPALAGTLTLSSASHGGSVTMDLAEGPACYPVVRPPCSAASAARVISTCDFLVTGSPQLLPLQACKLVEMRHCVCACGPFRPPVPRAELSGEHCVQREGGAAATA